MQFTESFDNNVNLMNDGLGCVRNADIIYRRLSIDGVNAGLFFVDGFVDDSVMQRILQYFCGLKKEDLESEEKFTSANVPYVEVGLERDISKAQAAVLSGMQALFIDGFDMCVLIECRSYPVRSVSEPWKDKVMRGSRDGFVETLITNLALIRRRVRTAGFSVEMLQVGDESFCDVALCYIEGRADMKLVENLRNKISAIRVDALTMNIQSIAECMLPGRWINPFPKYKYSERPDTAAAALFDGNIILMVDNSPAVMILPTSIFDLMEEADDFYFPPLTGCYLRLSRFLISLAAVFLTPIWLLLIKNPELIPGWLEFITITDDITIPVIVQLLILETAIDGLKMAAINTPNALSTPLSVVAGIIVGEYAISSGWFNAESMLYMAFVIIATYSQASFEMGYAIKFVRVMLLILVQFFGLWGFLAGCVFSAIMIAANRTLSGKSFIYPLVPFNGAMLKRKLFRVRLPHTN